MLLGGQVDAVSDQARTIDHWIALIQRNQSAARILLKQNVTAEAWYHAGFAVECAMKAAIMRHRRYNAFPDRETNPELYVHNLHALAVEAGLDIKALVRDPIATNLQVVLMWGRSASYDPKPMPVTVARDMVEAACGADGVIAWLDRRFRIGIS